MVTDERVVDAAVKAAESVVFSQYDRPDLDDIDIAVGFEDGILDVDVYLNAPEAENAGAVAEEAALAARGAVDDLLEG
jgi:hypothetical protein